jgi:hypothetical protein
MLGYLHPQFLVSIGQLCQQFTVVNYAKMKVSYSDLYTISYVFSFKNKLACFFRELVTRKLSSALTANVKRYVQYFFTTSKKIFRQRFIIIGFYRYFDIFWQLAYP